jgi:small subunit ribosomal protein S17
METRDNKRKTLTATVISDKMMKTRVVQVVSLRKHPMYGKQMKFHTKFKAHDEKNEAHTGDVVEIMETRPLSKEKRWTIVQIIKKGEAPEAVGV